MTQELFQEIINHIKSGKTPCVIGHSLTKEQIDTIKDAIDKQKNQLDCYFEHVIKLRLAE